MAPKTMVYKKNPRGPQKQWFYKKELILSQMALKTMNSEKDLIFFPEGPENNDF